MRNTNQLSLIMFSSNKNISTHQGRKAWHNSSTTATSAATDNFSHGAQRNNHPVIDCRAPFFVSFLEKQKRKRCYQSRENTKSIKAPLPGTTVALQPYRQARRITQ